jgi:WD40 repeat protein
MPLDLVGALVGWLVSLVSNAGIRLMRRSSDERALRNALRLAIDKVVRQANASSQEVLREGLRQCFSAPPRLALDATTSVSDGLRAAITAQVAQLDQMMHGDSGELFYNIVSVDRVWLIDQVTAAILTALPQVAAASSLAELINVLNAEGVATRLDALGVQISELRPPGLNESGQSSARGATAWGGPVWAVPPLHGDEIARPGLMEELVAVVTRPGVSAVGITTGLWGAGGFGKTTMARLLVHREEVREEFRDGVVWVTVGEDAAGPELADKVTNAVCVLSGGRPALTDPLAAGVELGRVLGDRRVLLVVDDVWTCAQVEPFLIGGYRAVRLFTTRVRGVLPPSAQPVQVDAMNHYEAKQLLTAGVDGASGGVVAGLLAATGRWAVLLALVNGAVRAEVNAGHRAEESMRDILRELRTTGPTALDIVDAEERHTAVARTIGVSLGRLTVEQRARYLELAVFGEDVVIPGAVLARYWKATGGWSEFQTRRFCQRLAELALAIDYRRDPEQVVLHDVLRAYLREQTRQRCGELDHALIEAHRGLVTDEGGTSAWWQLPAGETYLWTRLPTHLRGAGLEQELRACVHHPGWLVGKLEHAGPAGLEADLALSDDPLSRALGTAVRRNAHVLEPLQPPGSLAATLATRLPGEGPTAAIAEQLVAGLTGPHLRAITTLPDLPDPTLSPVPTGHTSGVPVLGVAPDGSWLASASDDETVRIWDPLTGSPRHTLTGHTGRVSALGVAPDGSWLASVGWDGTVRIWDPLTGSLRHTLTGHTRPVGALGVASDGSWLASVGWGGEVRIWDPVTGSLRHTLTGHIGAVWALGVASDGSWLASAGWGGEVRIWDPVTGSLRHTLTGHIGEVMTLGVVPDGSWLASAGWDGTVRIWDPLTGSLRHTPTGHHSRVLALGVAPDGSWLASAGWDGTVRIWDPLTGSLRHTLTGHAHPVGALGVASDGSWLASAGWGGEVRIWDPVTGSLRHTLTGHIGAVWALGVAPDGYWLASASDDGTVRLWDPVTGSPRHTLTDHTRPVRELGVASDGSWLASASLDGEVRIWDPVTGIARHTLTGHIGAVRALGVAPDGSWLASAGWDGEVRLWDPVTGSPRHTLTDHTRPVRALGVASDGSWLASAGWDGEVRIWDPVTGSPRHTLTGHIGAVRALGVASDGSWLASASDDGTVRIWDPVTGAALTSLRVASALSFLLPTSTTIAAAGERGLYFLTLCHRPHPGRRCPDRSD